MPHHDGETYDPGLDKPRLNAQTQRVFDLLLDGQWRTLYEMSDCTGDPTQSVSARVRDLRKEKFGAHTVEKRRCVPHRSGTFEYRLLLNANNQAAPSDEAAANDAASLATDSLAAA